MWVGVLAWQGGFSALNPAFCITRSENSVSHLLTSHTCFHTVNMPPYPTPAVLRERVLASIGTTSQGFGFL
jgi:hypothetical protein